MDEDLRRLTTRCMTETANQITSQLPPSWRQRVYVQLLPMSQVLPPACGVSWNELLSDITATDYYLPRIKSAALAVYSAIDRVVAPSLINANRTLTGMGPAAEKEEISVKFEVRFENHRAIWL